MTWLKHKGKYFNINENKWKSVRGHDCEGGSMSETPRTDEHLRRKEENGHTVIVSSEFARQLETELADAKLTIQSLEVEKLQLAKSLYLAASDFTSSNGSIPDWWKDCKEIARKMLELESAKNTEQQVSKS